MQALSTVPRLSEADGTPQQYLTFQLSGEPYAVNIHSIREIIEYGALTTVPLMPESIRGVINLRGMVVPVVDLASRLGKPQTEITRRTCIVILELGAFDSTSDSGQTLGMVVDAVSEVLEIATADIEPPPAFGSGIRSEFIAGMGKMNGGFVILLDAQRVLSVDEMAQLGGGAVVANA